MPYMFLVNEKRLRAMKMHSIPELIRHCRNCIEVNWPKRWFDCATAPWWDGIGPRFQPAQYARTEVRDAIKLIRRLRAESARRQQAPTKPHPNRGKGTACPLQIPSRKREVKP